MAMKKKRGPAAATAGPPKKAPLPQGKALINNEKLSRKKQAKSLLGANEIVLAPGTESQLAVYDGRRFVGTVGKTRSAFAAFDPNCRVIGTFPTQRKAGRALVSAVRT